MSPNARHKQQLMDRLAELSGRVVEIADDLSAPLTGDWEEDSVERQSDEVLETLESNDEVEILQIESALARMDEGEYGVCVKCGERISEKRLDMLPATPFCRKCAK